MGAVYSVALCLEADEVGRLLTSVPGLVVIEETEAPYRVHLDAPGGPLAGVVRAYDEGGWTSVTIDIDVEVYERRAAEQGRAALAAWLVELAVGLVRQPGVRYALIDEEIEAELGPREIRATHHAAIQVFEPGLAGLDALAAHPRTRRVERLPGAVVVWLRDDLSPTAPDTGE